MKKIVFLTCFILMYVWAFSQWTCINPLPQSISLKSVCFTDSNTGYAVGDSGTIIKTTDAGLTWTSLSSGTNYCLHSVCFPNANTGYVVGGYFMGDRGIILKTIDAGKTWTVLLTGNDGLWFNSVCFTDANTGYVTENFFGFPLYNNYGAIIKTTDGGITWSTLPPGRNDSFSLVYFTDTNTGYAIGSYDTVIFYPTFGCNILKTIDAGETWTETLNGGCFVNSVYFTDANTGYFVNPGSIHKTVDAGTTWTFLTGIDADIKSVYFTDSNIGYIVGVYGEYDLEEGRIFKTTDAGAAWTALSTGSIPGLNSVYFTDANTGYAVGNHGTILKTTNGGGIVSIQDPVLAESSFTIYPNPATNKITISTNRKLPGETTISIINISGQQLMQARFQNQTKFEMDVSTLSKGIYLVKIQTNTGIETKKLVIQ